jgi:large subunit ribosomal protein L13
MGKHKPVYDPGGGFSCISPHCSRSPSSPPGLVDCGDYVIVTNARKIRVTGNKEKQIIYRHHTMYPGGLKEKSYRDLMAHRPEEVRVTRI